MFKLNLQPIVYKNHQKIYNPKGRDLNSLNKDISKFNKVAPIARYGVFSVFIVALIFNKDFITMSFLTAWMVAVFYCAAKASKPPIVGVGEKGISIYNLSGEEFVLWDSINSIEYRPRNMSGRDLWKPILTIGESTFNLSICRSWPFLKTKPVEAHAINISRHYPDIIELVNSILRMNRDKVVTKNNAYPFSINPWFVTIILLAAGVFFTVLLTTIFYL